MTIQAIPLDKLTLAEGNVRRTHELAVDTGQIHHARLDPPPQSGIPDRGRDGRVQSRAVDVYEHQPREVAGQLFEWQLEGLPSPQYDCEFPAFAPACRGFNEPL